MVYALLIIAMILFSVQAFRAKRLIVAALWLAGTSALLSILFYLLGAYMVAVIELSVGAGLVTVLFAFAISIAGEEQLGLRSILPISLVGAVVILAIALLGWITLPVNSIRSPITEPPLGTMLWQVRSLDIFVQIVLIFAGVLGLLGLLAEAKAPLEYPIAEEVAARRERELKALEQQILEKEAV